MSGGVSSCNTLIVYVLDGLKYGSTRTGMTAGAPGTLTAATVPLACGLLSTYNSALAAFASVAVMFTLDTDELV